MASETIRPTVTSFLDIMLRDKDAKLRIAEARVGSKSQFTGRTIEEIEIHKKTGALVLAIKRGEDYIYNPVAATKVQSEDILIVMATLEQMEKIKELTEVD